MMFRMKEQKRFVCRTFLFAICVACFFVCVWICAIPGRKLVIPSDVYLLFLGTSRIQYSINDKCIPASLNWGNNGENYFWTYQKLKMVWRYNKNVDVVMLICDKPSLTIWFEDNTPVRFSPYFFDILSTEDYRFLLKHDVEAFGALFNWQQVFLPYRAYLPNCEVKSVGLGGYVPLERDELETDILRRKKDKQNGDATFEVNSNQVLYLDKIVSFCKQNGIQIVFLTPPSYPIPDYVVRHRKMVRFLRERYPEVAHWDYEFVALPDSCYGDVDHLNLHGAEAFTRMLRKRILSMRN